MRVAYLVSSPRAASYKIAQMVLPQLEVGTHVAQVVAMFFFDDNTMVLQKGNPIGERLSKIAKEKGIILMMCDACALERGLAKGEPKWCDPITGEGRKNPAECYVVNTVDGVEVGCFPDLYSKLAGKVDLVITL
ncbi:MAG: SaoD/DsrE family protein [Spirochaetia bacterium]|nr:SaoD/DsrE family protein [Spirochaetota bacterium]MCX8097302.1 SaoD/DsrE family protein [Spirochaetota bacterium]MDW8112849.1 SaoD/DsrE family protein [Spirochaetia bacterium]